MFANRMKIVLSAIAGLVIASAACAQGIAALPAKTADTPPIQQPQAAPARTGPSFVIGPPVVQEKDEKGLIYRDPSQPLTIGEMAEMQKQKAIQEFLKKAGYTTEKPPAPVKVEDDSKKVPEKVESLLTVRALFASEGGEPFAEISTIDGTLMKVRAGSLISKRLKVASTDGSMIALLLAPEVAPECQITAKGKKAPKKQCLTIQEPTLIVLGSGDQYRWFD